MLGGGAGARAAGSADNDGDPARAAEHVAQLGCLVHELVHRVGDEVGELDLGYRAHAHEGGPDAQSDEAGLRERRVHHPVLAELLDHAPAHAEGPAVDPDVLAHEEDGVVLAHRLDHRLADGLAVGDLPRHRRPPARSRARARAPVRPSRRRPRPSLWYAALSPARRPARWRLPLRAAWRTVLWGPARATRRSRLASGRGSRRSWSARGSGRLLPR